MRFIKACFYLLFAAIFYVWYLFTKTVTNIVLFPGRALEKVRFDLYLVRVFEHTRINHPHALLVPEPTAFVADAYKARELYRKIQKLVFSGKYPGWNEIFTDSNYVCNPESPRDFCRLTMALYYFVEETGELEYFINRFDHAVLTIDFLKAVSRHVENGFRYCEDYDKWKDTSLSREERIQAHVWTTRSINIHSAAIYRSHPSILEKLPYIREAIAVVEDNVAVHRMAEFVIDGVDDGMTSHEALTTFFKLEFMDKMKG